MLITCADCGSTQILPMLPSRGTAACRRCDRILERRLGTRYDVALECWLASLVLLPPAIFLPLMESTIRHLVYESSRLVTSVAVIYHQVWYPLALGFLLFAFLFPAVRALLVVVVLGTLRWGWRVPEVGRLFRWSEELRIWSMTDIVVVAGVLTYFRAAAPAEVDVRVGAWCYLAVAVLAFVADRTLDRRAVWSGVLPDPASRSSSPTASCPVCELTLLPGSPLTATATDAAAGRRFGRCPRCGAALDPDVVRRFAGCLALLAAAVPLTVPAYSYAVLVNERVTGIWEHSVLGTVQLLAEQGLWQFGAVVLIAGVAIPVFEMVTLAWLLVRVRFPRRAGLMGRTRVYRVAHDIARWPMIIPFLAAIAAPIVDFEGLDEILAGPGATPFFLLVVVLLLAVRVFEPRLMWRTAGVTA